MSRHKKALLIILSSLMELSWIYGLIVLLYSSFKLPPLSWSLLTILFSLIIITTKISLIKSYLVIQHVLIQLILLIIVFMKIVHFYYNYQLSFFNITWLSSYLNRTADLHFYLVNILIALITLLLLYNGYRLVIRQITYQNICNRFDLGLGIFFFLLIINDAAKITAPIQPLLVPFFVSSLLAIGLSRGKNNSSKNSISNYQRTGLLLSFIISLLIVSLGLISTLLPYLSSVAEQGYTLASKAASPFLPLLTSILKYIFNIKSPGSAISTPASGTADSESVIFTSPFWLQYLEKILGYGLIILLFLLLLALLFFLIKLLLNWLFSKTRNSTTLEINYRQLLKNYWLIIKDYCLGMYHKKKHNKGLDDIYLQLIRWGRFRGLSPTSSDTPSEYASRLAKKYPLLVDDIQLIIYLYNYQTYSNNIIKAEQINRARLALRRIKHKNWPIFPS